MIPRFPFSILPISLLLVVASANLDEENSSSEFSYMGLKGPDHWGGLNKSFSPCATGKHQSPVNILTKQTHIDTTLGPLAKNYIPAANATIINLGFVIGVHYEEEIGDLVIKGKKYTFKQMHWHTPAEHQIDGQIFHAELHAVHLADDGSAAVISILYNYGNPDPLVNKISKYLYELGGSSSHKGVKIPMGKLDTSHLRRKTNKFYRYMGSLTTPPCTEDVVWTVLARARSISKEQVEALRAPLASHSKTNARPLQPLNGRTVELYKVKNGHHRQH